MNGRSVSEYRSCCGFALTSTAMKLVILYYIVWSLLLSQLPMPWTSFYIGIAGVIASVLAIIGIVLKNAALVLLFFCYALFSIFLLLYLGGYYFFVTIFYRERIKDEFGFWFEDLFLLIHFVDVVCLLIHYYTLGIILKYRTLVVATIDKEAKVSGAEPASTALRSDTNYDMA